MSEIEHGLLSLGSGPAVDGGGRAERKSAFDRHCHGNSLERALRAKPRHASCRCDGILPLCGSFGSEDPQCASGDEVALKVKGVVNRTVSAEEALGGSSRLEPLQLALAASDCLMRILPPIVLFQPLAHHSRCAA